MNKKMIKQAGKGWVVISASIGALSFGLFSHAQSVQAAETWTANTPDQIEIKEGDTEYTLKKGDTLWAISMKINVNVQTLAAINNINLETGEQYSLPVGLVIKFEQGQLTAVKPNGEVQNSGVTVNDTNKVVADKPVGTDVTQDVQKGQGNLMGQPNNVENGQPKPGMNNPQGNQSGSPNVEQANPSPHQPNVTPEQPNSDKDQGQGQGNQGETPEKEPENKPETPEVTPEQPEKPVVTPETTPSESIEPEPDPGTLTPEPEEPEVTPAPDQGNGEETPEKEPDTVPETGQVEDKGEETPGKEPETNPEKDPEVTPSTPEAEKPSTPESTTPSDTKQEKIKSEFHRLLNEERQSLGLPPYGYMSEIDKATETRAYEISENGVFSHTRPDGTKWTTIMDTSHLNGYLSGENIVFVSGDDTLPAEEIAADMFNKWKNSPGHYANMTSNQHTNHSLGIYQGVLKGISGYYGISIFFTQQ